jgi:hypothetical protein
MFRWGGWVQCAVAASACGVTTMLAACSAGSDAATSSVATSPASAASSSSDGTGPAATPSTTATHVAPLTGLAVTGARARQPAVAVAVAGRDPSGLRYADLVVEEMTTPVRYLAVYQSQEAGKVGPVTGTTPTDGQELSVLHPLTAYNGGTNGFIFVLDATKVIDDGYAGHARFYSAGPHGLTVSPTAVAAAGRPDGPPPGLFLYRAPGSSLASAGETHPTSVRVQVPGKPTARWSYAPSSGRWVETAGGPRVSVANVVVQIVPYRTVYLSHRYNQTAQSARAIGQGQATVFSGSAPGSGTGSAAAGSWSKPGLAAVTNYFDTAHVPMSFEPGPTWVVLAPAGTRVVQTGG